MKINLKIPPTYMFYSRMTLLFFLIQNLVRIILVVTTSVSFFALTGVLVRGFIWDLEAWAFLGLPLLLVSLSISKKSWKYISNSITGKILAFLLIYVMLFVGFCELTFWEEFHSRFNFIAVDYLIYTNEVIANINESFPMPVIFTVLFFISGILVFLVHRITIESQKGSFLSKKIVIFFGLFIPVITGLVIGPYLDTIEPNFRRDQLSRNGWVEFYRAFRSNSIDYKNFYATIPSEKAKNLFEANRQKTTNGHLLNTKPNVVMIVVESLGAKFIGPLGGQKDATPYLNQLSDRSIFFENLYATGTRTVRGLEAINLSVPPTPGYAVVKRPVHKNLYSLGHTFKTNGYDPIFLYGGRGFFDNMNSFFEGNGFRTIDQSAFSEDEVTFSNAWGVCDEDLFSKAFKIMEDNNTKTPKLLFMLTTSNHRPFTYPDGRVDIPSGESRAGAVKYTDYAIRKFIEESLRRPWAKNTIFVIVADHSTEGRGRFDLEMADYHIPMWIYSPNLLPPSRIRKLVSQIDILPSLVHLLGLNDNSPFFGKSFFLNSNTEDRAFIGNYQYVGFYKNNTLTTLGPNRNVRTYTYDLLSKKQKSINDTSPFLDEGISYYQYASELLTNGGYSVRR